MSRSHVVAVGLVGALACAEPPAPQSELGEVCGEAGPVRLLALEPGQHLSDTTPFRVGDRLYFRTVRPIAGESDSVTRGEAWSTGLCGEDPRLLADGLRWISPVDQRWPGRVIGCLRDKNSLVLLDPAGGPPTPLMPGTDCFDTWTEHGVVNEVRPAGSQDVALMLHPYPEDPLAEAPPPRVLHPRIRESRLLESGGGSNGYFIQRTLADAVYVIDADDRLLRVDLLDGAATTKAVDVHGFLVSDDGRYLLWQRLAGESGVSPVILQDRETGVGASLGEFELIETYGAFDHLDHSLVQLWKDDRERELRVIRLPGLEPFDLPRDHDLAGVIDEGRWLLRSADLSIFDAASRETTVLMRGEGSILDVTPERALFLRREPYTTQSALYWIPLDGATPQVVAPRANTWARLYGEGRLVTVVDLDDLYRGRLLLVDLDSASEQVLEERVALRSVHLDACFGPGHLVYSVDDGARSGVYVVRLPDP